MVDEFEHQLWVHNIFLMAEQEQQSIYLAMTLEQANTAGILRYC